jgi:uncharacterized protein YlxW (UPF0749 family)
VGLVAVAAGFLMVAGATTADGTDLRAERRTELADLIRAREAEVVRQSARIATLQAEVDAVTSTQDPTQPSDALSTEALERAAGMLPVKGPGLTVELDDAPREAGQPLPEGVQPDDLVVHQQDVQAVVNALWSGGAEAMTIMDQRVVATSAVRCVGNTLILQGRVYAPPFTISAVGDQAAMRQALDAASGVTAYRDWSDAVGLGYSVTDEPTLSLPGYDGPLDLNYAKGSR